LSGGVPVIVLARTFDPDRPLTLDLQRSVGGVAPVGLGPGEAVVATALAHRLGVAPGGEIELATRAGPRRYRVVATATEYTVGGAAVYLSFEAATAAFGAGGADAFMVRARPGALAAAGSALAALCAREGLLLQSNADLRGAVEEKVNGIVGLLWTVLAVVFLVASLGVVNSLTMNVLDQTREIGVLRAVAMTRGQVRRMVLSQALAMAAMGLAPGAVAGVGLSLLMNAGVEPVRGFPIEFHLVPGLVAGCVGVALAVALAAAVVPAWRASRLPVTTALHYE